MSAEQRLQHLDQRLKLSDEQKSKIKPLLEDEQQKMAELRQNGSDDRRQQFAKFREIHQATSQQIRSVLTGEQQKQFDAMEKEQQGRFGHHRGMRDGGGPGGMEPPPPPDDRE